jgi:hypothetical protein
MAATKTKNFPKYTEFNDATGYFNSANFQDGIDGSEALIKTALVAHEGTFRDSLDVSHTFDSDRLVTIADYTNKALDAGTTIPVCTDHKKDVAHTVGSLGIDARAYTKPIEITDLPNPKATHLLGKLGLFVDNVTIKAAEAIDKVRNGIVTSVSMGLNLDPKDHRLIELSLVPIPAIPNMGLFKMGIPDDSNAFTWEELESDEQSLDELKDDYDELTSNLWVLLNNIYNSESIDISDMITLQQYVYTTLNGFSVRVLDLLGLANLPTDQTGLGSNTLTADGAQQMQQTQIQGVDAQAQQPAIYRRGNSNVASFGCAKKYIRTRK